MGVYGDDEVWLGIYTLAAVSQWHGSTCVLGVVTCKGQWKKNSCYIMLQIFSKYIII